MDSRDSPTRQENVSAQRRLLARVRDVMAGPGKAQERLDSIVSVIAADMVSEVCSVYVRRPGDVLELFATQGLKPSAVHRTRLFVGEGIVGDIAATSRPFALAEAQTHPSFAYRPETGEEIFHSMMGVPILRSGRVIGVIAVQNRSQRHYTEEEVETLQTVAMVLAELIAGGELIDRKELVPSTGLGGKPLRVEGLALNAGLGMGVAVLHRPIVKIEKMVADDPAVERKRLRVAFTEMHGALDTMMSGDQLADGGEHTDVLEAYRLIAEDAGWLARIEEGIETGLTAEASVQRVQNDIRARMSQVTDPYLRERVHDLDDLAFRLISHLSNGEGGFPDRELPEDSIVVARSMGPAQLLDYDRTRLKGLVLEEGAPASHVAIIARALGIPVIGRARDVTTRIDEGDTVIVDANHASVYIRPGGDARQAFRESVATFEEREAQFAGLRDLPAETQDGVHVELQVNAGLMVDIEKMRETGAEGVGLFRTEIPFMVRDKLPGVTEQTRLYQEVIEGAGDKPVVFRILDIGGDKVLPYWDHASEENPALGWRAIRVLLDRPALLRQQLRALIRATEGGELRIMFPMIAEVSELVAARELFERELARERERGGPVPGQLRVGVMLEVPGLALQLPTLLKMVDFVSVGSNDLGQFLFASDRGNPRLAGRYDTLSPIQLKFLKNVVDECTSAGVPVNLCGEMAGKPLEAMALLAIGFRRISMAASNLGRVKAMVRSLELGPLADYMSTLYDLPDRSLREHLKSFARDHGVMI